MSSTWPESGSMPEGISRETTGDLSPNLFKSKIESCIFVLSFPLRPVPIRASTITVLLDTLRLLADLVFITLTFDSFISWKALLDMPLSSLAELLITTVTSRPNSFAKQANRKPSPEFFPFEQKIISFSIGENSLRIMSKENSAAICISE